MSKSTSKIEASTNEQLAVDSVKSDHVAAVVELQGGSQTDKSEETRDEDGSVDKSEYEPLEKKGDQEMIHGGTENNEEQEEDDDKEIGEEEEETEDDGEAEEDEEEEGEGEEEEEEDGDESESEYSEDEEEPKLKYHRLGAGVTELLKKDAASCMMVSDKFVALGTHWGMIYILDFEGNEVKRFRSHSATVNHLSIDSAGEYVASASDDGKVVINGLYVAEAIAFNHRRPVKCVAIDPEYSRKTTRQFISGGMAGRLIMHEKGWFSQKETVLHSGEGPIIALQWRGNFVAWSNDAGVNIYDTVSSQRIAFIDRPHGSPRPDLYKCHLCWRSDDVLMIGWANCVKVTRIKERPRIELVSTGFPMFQVEILTMFQTDYVVCGIAPFNDTLLVLAYNTDQLIQNEETVDGNEQRRKIAQRPELRIIGKNNEELSSDALSLIGFERYQPNDYVLDFLPSEDLFYVVSPKDLVVARPRDLNDHIVWLLSHLEYEKALAAVEEASEWDRTVIAQKGHTVEEIGQKYLSFLMEEGQYEKAAELCPRVLGTHLQKWEDCVFKFAELRQLKVIASYIPTSNPQLSSTVYEMVLAHFLTSDYTALLETIKQWPSGVYDSKTVTKALEDRLEKLESSTLKAPRISPSKTGTASHGRRASVTEVYTARTAQRNLLMKTLAELHTMQGRPDRALEYHLRLGTPDAIGLIIQHQLFEDVRDKIVLLMDFDRRKKQADDDAESEMEEKVEEEERGLTKEYKSCGSLLGRKKARRGPAVDLLVSHTEDIPVAIVVEQLFSRPALLHVYLDALFDQEPALGSEFHDLQVELYAEFDRGKLLDFLRASNFYSLAKSYAICEQRDLVPEMVFILGRMGNNKRALGLIIERLGDVERAIDFAKEQDDADLWEDLVSYSLDKPDFIKGLLENVGTHIDPVKLIRRVPEDLEIPGLKESLRKILFDYNLQSSLLEGSQKILVNDSVHLADRLHRAQKRGVLCSGETTCAQCQNPLFVQGNNAQLGTTVLFFCKHAYHDSCIVESPPNSPEHHAEGLGSTLYLSGNRPSVTVTGKMDQSRLLRGRGAGCPLCREDLIAKKKAEEEAKSKEREKREKDGW